jgi:hypothetical protein
LCLGIFTRKGQALQFNWILEKGGFVSHGNDSFSVDYSRVRECVEDLSRVILKIEATGDKAAAQALLKKYAILTPELQRAFSHLEDVQVFSAPPLDYCNLCFRDILTF